MKDKIKTSLQLSEFGKVMATACTVFAGVSLWKRGDLNYTNVSLLSLACGFYLLAVLCPEKLRVPEKLWMGLAEKLSVIVTFFIVTLTFFLIISPIGLILRIFGKDLLSLKISRGEGTYWEPVDPHGSGSRHYLPY